MQALSKDDTLIGLDVGEKRIGVAAAHMSVRMPYPLTTLEHPERFIDDIIGLVCQETASAVVIGLPRGMQGQDTAQTRAVQAFGDELASHVGVPVYWTDEALTSQQAERELDRRRKPYPKSAVDALAASYILEDFLNEKAGQLV